MVLLQHARVFVLDVRPIEELVCNAAQKIELKHGYLQRVVHRRLLRYSVSARYTRATMLNDTEED